MHRDKCSYHYSESVANKQRAIALLIALRRDGHCSLLHPTAHAHEPGADFPVRAQRVLHWGRNALQRRRRAFVAAKALVSNLYRQFRRTGCKPLSGADLAAYLADSGRPAMPQLRVAYPRTRTGRRESARCRSRCATLFSTGSMSWASAAASGSQGRTSVHQPLLHHRIDAPLPISPAPLHTTRPIRRAQVKAGNTDRRNSHECVRPSARNRAPSSPPP
jgi:hypothetical protein